MQQQGEQPAERSDEQLMIATTAGDLHAFDTLLTRYERRIVNYAWRILGDSELARDVCQQTFLKIFQKRENYRPEARFSTYAYYIAHRLCLNELRRAERKRTSSYDQKAAASADEQGSGIENWYADSGPNPGEPLEVAERNHLLHQALEQLDVKHRQVIVLRIFDNLPFRDIAAIAGSNESTVKSRLRYGLQQLDKALRRQIGPPQ